jgi:tetratricopeptide (TPR) repeat protein
MRASLARAYVYAGQNDQAISVCRTAPDFPNCHRFMAQAYAAKGMAHEAAAEYQKAADLLPNNPQKLYHSGLAQALAGRESEAQKTIDEMKALAAQRYVSPAYIAYIYSQLGRKEETLEWLEKAYADHSFELIFVKVNPKWDLVRSDPRFTDLLRRMRLTS